jgi:hypothetical protein
MQVELGPVAITDMQAWLRFARRLITELRTDPDELAGIATDDFLSQWSTLIEEWDAASRNGGAALADGSFRWSQRLGGEEAEFLLHGLERCLHSATIRSKITSDEAATHRAMTMHLVQAFVDGLSAEGQAHQHYADQVKALFGPALD